VIFGQHFFDCREIAEFGIGMNAARDRMSQFAAPA
jgi:hypothetical protein